MERVYEINRNFRNEGIDTRHNPEFTMMELYQAYSDLAGMMELTETLLASLAAARHSTLNLPVTAESRIKLPYGERLIDFTAPFQRIAYSELFSQHVGVAMTDAQAVQQCATQHGIADAAKTDHDVLVGILFERLAEPKLNDLDQPVFVYDYPAGLCPLTKRKTGQPHLAERFELYIAGMELANAYTELNDPFVQYETFSAQLAGLKEEDSMARMDHDFIAALCHGMPPAGAGNRHRSAGDVADQQDQHSRRGVIPVA